LAKKGEYYSLWNAQQEEQALKDKEEAELLRRSGEDSSMESPEASNSSASVEPLI
jgi:hypothetical protein